MKCCSNADVSQFSSAANHSSLSFAHFSDHFFLSSALAMEKIVNGSTAKFKVASAQLGLAQDEPDLDALEAALDQALCTDYHNGELWATLGHVRYMRDASKLAPRHQQRMPLRLAQRHSNP